MSRPHPFATRGGLRAVRPKQPTPPPPEPLPVLPSTEQDALCRLCVCVFPETGFRADPALDAWAMAACSVYWSLKDLLRQVR